MQLKFRFLNGIVLKNTNSMVKALYVRGSSELDIMIHDKSRIMIPSKFETLSQIEVS